MQFKLFSRNALRLGAFLLTISLAACSDPPAQQPTKEEPGRPTNSELPKNMTDQPKDFNDFGYNEDPVDLCEYINQKCKVDQPTNSAKWLGCVNVDPNNPTVGVCKTLCNETMRCSANPESCVPWKSQATAEPSTVSYTGYCSSSGSECEGYFDAKTCGAGKRCIPDKNSPKRFVCDGQSGPKPLGAACTSHADCEANAYCADDLEGNPVCSKLCLTEEKVLSIVGDTPQETVTLREPYLCASGTACLFSESAGIIATGIGLCMDTTNICQPGQTTCTTQGGEYGVCIATPDGSFCKHFNSAGNEKAGTKGMFEVCDTANPCSAGLVCATINNDGQNYCVQPCRPEEKDSCNKYGNESRNPGKNSSYMCLAGLIPGFTKAAGAVSSSGYCVLNCAADQYGQKCKDGADTSLKSNAICTIAEFNQNRTNNLQVLSGAFCLDRPNTKTSGEICNSHKDYCGVGYTCTKANPSAAQETCVEKVVCQSDSDCAGGKKCNFGTFSANNEKGNKLGICRKPCTPNSDYLDTSCDSNEQRCVQIGLDNNGKQFTFCSDSTGTDTHGTECTIARVDEGFAPTLRPVLTASHPIKDQCEPSLTCITGADTGNLSSNQDFNKGHCRKRCHLFSTSSGCDAGEVCGVSALGNLLEHGSPADVAFLTPICLEAVNDLKDKKHGELCEKAFDGKPCASGSTCREFLPGEYRCLDLCKTDSDCKRPPSYSGEIKCVTSPRYGLGTSKEWGVCRNFND